MPVKSPKKNMKSRTTHPNALLHMMDMSGQLMPIQQMFCVSEPLLLMDEPVFLRLNHFSNNENPIDIHLAKYTWLTNVKNKKNKKFLAKYAWVTFVENQKFNLRYLQDIEFLRYEEQEPPIVLVLHYLEFLRYKEPPIVLGINSCAMFPFS